MAETEIVKRGELRWVIFTYDTSNNPLWEDCDEIQEEFLHPDDLHKATGDVDPEKCSHQPHSEIKAKYPDDRHEGSYCTYCGKLLYAG